MQVEENEPLSATTGSGGMSTDDTRLIEWAATSSFVAAGDRSISTFLTVLHVLKIPGQPQKRSNFLADEPEQGERHTISQKKKAETLESEAWSYGSTKLNPRSLLPI